MRRLIVSGFDGIRERVCLSLDRPLGG